MSRLDDLIAELCPDGVPFDYVENLCLTLSPAIKIKSNDYLSEGLYPIIDQGQELIGGYTNRRNIFPKDEYIIFGDHTCVIKYVNFAFAQGADGIKVLRAKKDVIISRYLFHCMTSIRLDVSYARHWSKMKRQRIPVPPLEVQREIVRILDSFTELTAELTAELIARKKQYEYYRDLLLTFDDVEYKKLGEIARVLRGKRLTKDQLSVDGKYPVFHGGLEPLGFYFKSNRPANSVMIINVGASAGTVGFCDKDFWSSDGCFTLEQKGNNVRYLYYAIMCQEKFLKSRVRKAGIPTLDGNVIEQIRVPLPPLEEQERIVGILDRFDKLCNDLSEGLPAEIEARQKQYEYYRDKLLSFENK